MGFTSGLPNTAHSETGVSPAEASKTKTGSGKSLCSVLKALGQTLIAAYNCHIGGYNKGFSQRCMVAGDRRQQRQAATWEILIRKIQYEFWSNTESGPEKPPGDLHSWRQ